MEFAWNTQKNKLSDVKGKEKEQDRNGKVKNEDIDFNMTHLNFDFVSSNLNLYQRVKNRVDEVRSVSRVQKNSVVMYSNVITIPKETHTNWGIKKSKMYLEEVYNYFCNEFGKENVVSAKVHLDETTPHMHLHFVPISEEGKLQARKVMTPGRINKIHSEAPKFLQRHGFDVHRGKGVTHNSNIKDIHKYKIEKLKEEISQLEKHKNYIIKDIDLVSNIKDIKDIDIKHKKGFIGSDKVVIDVNDYEYLTNTLKSFREGLIATKLDNLELTKDILSFKDREDNVFSIKNDYHNRLNILLFKEREFDKREKMLDLIEKDNRDDRIELSRKSNEIKQEYINLDIEKQTYKKSIYINLENEFKEEIEHYKFLSEFLEKSIVAQDRKNKFLERNSKLDSNILNSYISKYGTKLIDDFLDNKDFSLDNNSFIKINYSSKKELKENNTYTLKEAEQLFDALLKKYEEINFEYDFYKGSLNNLIHRDTLYLNKGLSFISELQKQINKFPSYFIKYKFNKDNQTINQNKSIRKSKSYEYEI